MAVKSAHKRLKVEEVKDEETSVSKEVISSVDSSKKENEVVEKEPVEEKKESIETSKEEQVTVTDEKSDKDEPKISSFAQVDVKKAVDIVKDEPAKKEEPLDLSTKDKIESVETEVEKEDDVVPEKVESETDKAKEWLEDMKPDQPADEESEEGGGKKKVFVIVFILAIISGIVAGGIYYYQTNITKSDVDTGVAIKEEETAVVEETATEEVTQESTESAEIDYSQITVNILNGSGIPGEAGRVSDLLSELEFSTPDTANADSYDYVETVVSSKEDVDESVIDSVTEILGATYMIEVSDENLDSDYDYDIEITVGSKKAD